MTAKKHLSNQNVEKAKGSGYLKRSLAVLGPGLITGAADDDPSGISTYSVAGAAYGYSTLWIALLTFPLMVSIQLMCARLGMVTGRGLLPPEAEQAQARLAAELLIRQLPASTPDRYLCQIDEPSRPVHRSATS